ncbi:MAG: hypothetical protein D5R97_02110 [Candidatus Syntrophonatronum acetioxidans]|uniref:Uncharacterized protein n=1 Tax=Candidatus Syntrophonatronum acetioxidans TaxID=1795816 RepID=A0A424YHB3_9FIRM|nr:MAG: hypothetical protein D5R97_02110 [Candidatus Syntrophonatronum acetioxidans]
MIIKEGNLIKVPAQELFSPQEDLGKKGWVTGIVKEVENIKGQVFPLTARVEFSTEERVSPKRFTLAFIDQEEFDCCAGIEATAFMKRFVEENPGRRVMVGFAQGDREICGVYLALWQDPSQGE